MANTLLTINMITREAVRLWKNSNAFLQNVDMQYDDSFAQNGAKIGNTLRIRLPNDYVPTNGPGVSLQDTAEQSTTLVLATQKNIAFGFNTAERTMSLDDYSRRIIAPAVNNLAGAVAVDIMSGGEGGICNLIANQDNAGNILSPIVSTITGANAILANNSAPTQDQRRKLIVSPISEGRMVATLSGLLNPAAAISKQFNTGHMYDALGFLWMQDQTTILHTNGTLAQNTCTVNGAGQTGLSLTVSNLTGSLNQGDIITIPGVFQVNRITKQSTGVLRQFAVTANVASSATSIPIYPALVPPIGGQPVQYQTVTASPANGAYVNLASGMAASSQYRKNFGYAPEAITMATADLEMPRGVHEAARENFDGISLRMVTDYVFNTDQLATRLDVLYGYLWVRPEWAVVVADAV